MTSPRSVLASATVAQAAVSFITYGLPAIGPELRREFGLSLPELGAVLSANLLGTGLALIAAGVAVDRFGPRAATLGGTALAVLGIVAAALADSKEALAGMLLLSGVGSAVVPVAGAGALFVAYRADRRGWALGVRQMAVPLGAIVGAVLVPALEAVGGVELALLVGAGTLGVAGTSLAVVAGTSPRSARRGLAVRTIWRTPGMQRLLLVAALYVVVLQAVLVYTVPAARAAALSPFVAGATYVALNVTSASARVAWGWVADRGGGARRIRTLVEAGLVAAVGALLFTAALHGGAAVVLPAAVIFGFGALGWNALVYVSAGERTPPELAGQSFAVAATVVFVISGVSTPPMGALAAHVGWDAFWLATAGLALAGALVAATLPRAAVRSPLASVPEKTK